MLTFRINIQMLILKLFLHLVLLASINCQSRNISSRIATTNAPRSSDKLESISIGSLPETADSISVQTTSNNASTATSTNTTTTATDKNSSTTTNDDVLLSSHEFVDFTEAPTLLFDGTSNENDTTSTITNVTSSPIVPLTSDANITESLNKTNTITLSDTFQTTQSPSIPTATVIPESVDDEEESETEGDEGQDDTKGNEPPPFSPPQNVSQYMDYIERLFHDLRHQITDLFEPHIPRLIRTSQMVQLSGSCSYDMLRMALALRQFEPWALRMIDSSGKVPEGIFEGSFTALGSYDECLNTIFASNSDTTPQSGPSHLSPNPAFSSSNSPSNQQQHQQNGQGNQPTQGKYCLVNVSPFLPPKPPVDRVESMFQEEANRRNYTKDDQFSRLSPMFYYMKFRIGVCIPSTCDDSDLESISSALSSSLRLNITIPHCRIKQSQPITSHQLIGGLVFAIVLALVIGATMMDYSRWKSGSLLENQKVFVLSIANEKRDYKDGGTKIPVLLGRTTDSSTDLKNTFSARLDKNWSWMSFSFLTNYKLYFKHKNPIIKRSREFPYKYTTKTVTTAPTIASVAQHDESTLNIKCLNGIRVLSLCWVIIANSYITLDPRATKLLTKTREAPKDFIFQMVAQASLAIETFFFLSGVLMSLSFARKLNRPTCLSGELAEENEKQSRRSYILEWIHFYIHRYIRMTPATMLVIAFTMFAYSFGDGPLWFEATHKAHLSCNKNWWRHLLHIANYIDTRQMCFIHYWYIAADMQLFLFAPILMFLLYQKRRIGYALATLIGLLSIGSVFYTTYIRNLPPTLLFYNSDPESRREFGNIIMTKPLTHALPYMVGMLVGKWLTSCRREIASQSWLENERSRSIASIFGILATIVALAEVFLPYKWNNSHLPTRLLSSIYAALFRFGWSLVLAYIVISCRHKQTKRCRNRQLKYESNNCTCKQQKSSHQFNNLERSNAMTQEHKEQHHYRNQHHNNDSTQRQHELHQTTTREQQGSPETGTFFCLCGSGGNLLNRLLGLSIFTNLSKLSFVAYLIHLPLMSVFVAQTRGLFAFSHTLVIHLALSYLFMTFILSFLLVHIIEFPFITFERYLFEKLFYCRGEGGAGRRGADTDQMATEKDSRQSSNSHSIEGYQSTEYCVDKMKEGNGLMMKYNHHHQQQQQQLPAVTKQFNSSEKFYLSERL